MASALIDLTDLIDEINELRMEIDELNSELAKVKRKPQLEPRFINQSEVRKLYGIGQKTLNKWVAAGIHEVPVGREIKYDKEEIDEYLDSLKI